MLSDKPQSIEIIYPFLYNLVDSNSHYYADSEKSKFCGTNAAPQ